MSKECLTVEQARTKLGFTGSIPASSNEIVNKEQCLAMKAKADLLAKYLTSWECPADDDIVKSMFDEDFITGIYNPARGGLTLSGINMGLIGCYATISGGSPLNMLLGNFTIISKQGKAMSYVMGGLYIVDDDHSEYFGNIYLRVYKGGGWPYANRVRIDIGHDPSGVWWFSGVFEFTDTYAPFDLGSNLIKPIGFSYMDFRSFLWGLTSTTAYNAPYKFVFYIE